METWLAWGFGREAGENTFQILIKLACGLQPPASLSLSLGFLFISSCLSLSPVSLLLPSQSPCLLPWISVSKSLVCFSLPRPFHASDSLSASTSVCPSPVLVHLSISLCLPVRGCLCPSAPPPICLVVCASPLEGTRCSPRAPSQVSKGLSWLRG